MCVYGGERERARRPFHLNVPMCLTFPLLATFLPATVKKVRPQFPSWTEEEEEEKEALGKKGRPGTRARAQKG